LGSYVENVSVVLVYVYVYTHTCIQGIYTTAQYLEDCRFIRNGKPNSETEGITGWLQIVAF
jgi:hypothetical protein